MKIYEVLKPFNTVNRRLAVGATMSDTDDISPFSFDERVASEFLKEKSDEQPVATTPTSKPRKSVEATPAEVKQD